MGGAGVNAHPDLRTGGNLIADNHIHHIGEVYHAATGIWIQHSGGNTITHNEIDHTYYSSIAIGWVWGYTPSITTHNEISFNHIHHVQSRTYGGWGIYPDEGSSDLLVESNLVHDCNRALFNQHYGRNNVVRNNIFAFGGDGQVSLSCIESHRSFSFSHNIVLFDSGVLFGPPNVGQVDSASLEWDHNLYFDRRGKKPRMAGLSWSAWITSGFDRNSIVADPRFKNADKRRFVLKKNSPASKIGFQPFDVKLVGPRSVR